MRERVSLPRHLSRVCWDRADPSRDMSRRMECACSWGSPMQLLPWGIFAGPTQCRLLPGLTSVPPRPSVPAVPKTVNCLQVCAMPPHQTLTPARVTLCIRSCVQLQTHVCVCMYSSFCVCAYMCLCFYMYIFLVVLLCLCVFSVSNDFPFAFMPTRTCLNLLSLSFCSLAWFLRREYRMTSFLKELEILPYPLFCV